MKAYVCDACQKTITDPYKEKMKEFFIKAQWEQGKMFFVAEANKKTIHLCEECYKGLHLIAEKNGGKHND